MADSASQDMIAAFNEDAQDMLNSWEQACLKMNERPIVETMGILLRCAHNLKGNAGLIGFSQLSDSVHRLEDRLIVISNSKVTPDAELMGILFEIEKFLRHWIQQLTLDNTFQPENQNVLAKLEAWNVAGSQSAPLPLPNREESAHIHAEASAAAHAAQETIRIASHKLDNLIQLVGELSLAQAIVTRGNHEERLESPQVKDAIGLCDKISTSLRNIVLDLRMLPMVGLYQRLERAAMETSVRLKKPVQILTEGQDVSLDKAVLHRIFDPLMHIIRNAIDHGIELPEDRRKENKNATGTVKIVSEISPRGVTIRIKDDGRGISKDRILKKAIERGLVRADHELSEQDIYSFMFQPGFSTAEKVTDISGRGVGLDVVLQEVTTLGGSIHVDSEFGVGTEFIITLPTNISLIDVLVARVGKVLYGVPKQDITEILDMQDLKIESSAAHKQMIRYHNHVLPIEPLGKYLIQNSTPAGPGEAQGCVLVVNYQNEIMGFHVNDIEGQQQVFIRPLKGYMASLPWMTGSTILSSGEPALIVNLKEITKDIITRAKRGQRLGEHSI